MLSVQTHKDIRLYKEKFLLGFTMRQCICGIAAATINISLYFALKKYVSQDLFSYIAIIIAAPFGFFGFFERYRLSAEYYLWEHIKFYYLNPRKLTIGNSALLSHIQITPNCPTREDDSYELIVLIEESIRKGQPVELGEIEDNLVLKYD